MSYCDDCGLSSCYERGGDVCPRKRTRIAVVREPDFYGALAAAVHPVWPRVLFRNLAAVVQLAAAEARGWAGRGMRDAPRFGY